MLSRQPGHSKQSAKIDFGTALPVVGAAVVVPSLADSHLTAEFKRIRNYNNFRFEQFISEVRTNWRQSKCATNRKIRPNASVDRGSPRETLTFSGEFDQDDTRYIYYGIFHNKFFLPNLSFLFYCCRYCCASVVFGHPRNHSNDTETIPFVFECVENKLTFGCRN